MTLDMKDGSRTIFSQHLECQIHFSLWMTGEPRAVRKKNNYNKSDKSDKMQHVKP